MQSNLGLCECHGFLFMLKQCTHEYEGWANNYGFVKCAMVQAGQYCNALTSNPPSGDKWLWSNQVEVLDTFQTKPAGLPAYIKAYTCLVNFHIYIYF